MSIFDKRQNIARKIELDKLLELNIIRNTPTTALVGKEFLGAPFKYTIHYDKDDEFVYIWGSEYEGNILKQWVRETLTTYEFYQ